MEMLSAIKNIYIYIEKLTHNVDKGSSLTMQNMHRHTHTHTVQTDRGEGQCCLTEIF